MSRPIPTFPVNIQTNNPYVGLDRGLFILRTATMTKYARVHAAKWRSFGPNSSIGILEFQIMYYDTKPTTSEELLAGIILPAPRGGLWFDTPSRNVVHSPILAEYWAMQSYLSYYSVDPDADILSEAARESYAAQARRFTEKVGSLQKITEIKASIDFETPADGPLTRTVDKLEITYVRNEVPQTLILNSLPTERFDPMTVAIDTVRSSSV